MNFERSTGIVMDTHVWVWLLNGETRLKPEQISVLHQARLAGSPDSLRHLVVGVGDADQQGPAPTSPRPLNVDA